MTAVDLETSTSRRVTARAQRVEALDGLAPVDVAERLRPLGGMALLESARPGRNARWSYLVADPVAIVEGASPGADPFAESRRALARLSSRAAGEGSHGGAGGSRGEVPPFLGGLVGHLAYDLGRRFERVPSLAIDDQPGPELRFQLHDWVLAHDRRADRWWIGGRALDGDAAALDDRLARVLARVLSRPATGAAVDGPAVPALAFRSGLDRAAYESGVEALRDAIARGEIYQANLTRRLEAAFDGNPWLAYRRLRAGDPALFAAFLPLGPASAGAHRGEPARADLPGGRAIVSASPEPFLRLDADGIVATDPIKGTRPRGRDRDDDRRLARELLASAKDRAENVMIVDVLRNDLGRVSRPGSVRVPRLCRLERTAAVQHLVSTVTGRLLPGVDAFDLLTAAFPGGSITGAPKIRAMQLIERLEPVRRGPYTGAAGWIGADGAMQTSILIRTLVADGRRLTLHVGGGITWRSDPAAEWDETVAKARGALTALGASEQAG